MNAPEEAAVPALQPNIIHHVLDDDGIFPNNTLLSLLIYRKALVLPDHGGGDLVKALFAHNGWENAWENGVYDYQHYHSTAHEVLGVVNGGARIQFGGPGGISLMLEQGDVVIIPAGVAHKNLGGDEQFKCVGAYPKGQQYDMNYGKKGERPETDENIRILPMPETDPVYGTNGPLIKNWKTNALKYSLSSE